MKAGRVVFSSGSHASTDISRLEFEPVVDLVWRSSPRQELPNFNPQSLRNLSTLLFEIQFHAEVQRVKQKGTMIAIGSSNSDAMPKKAQIAPHLEMESFYMRRGALSLASPKDMDPIFDWACAIAYIESYVHPATLCVLSFMLEACLIQAVERNVRNGQTPFYLLDSA